MSRHIASFGIDMLMMTTAMFKKGLHGPLMEMLSLKKVLRYTPGVPMSRTIWLEIVMVILKYVGFANPSHDPHHDYLHA